MKPDLFPDKKALVVTLFNPNSPQGGTSTILRNFLEGFSSDSFVVICSKSMGAERRDKLPVKDLITNVYRYSRWIRRIGEFFWLWRDIRRVSRFLRTYRPRYVLLVYPHLYNVRVFFGLDLPDECKVVAYFHDTFVEGQWRRVREGLLQRYHDRLLKSIDLLFVMNGGMQELYRVRYSMNSIALEHSFPEYDQMLQDGGTRAAPSQKTLFWGGNILGYNRKSLSRMAAVGRELGYGVRIASKQRSCIVAEVLGCEEYSQEFYENRTRYMSELRTNSFLLLALDWPDETDYHEDEVATIFSTKAIEYLMSGVPVVVHAPSHYFMSKFFLSNGCGYVISIRDGAELRRQFEMISSKRNHDDVLREARRVARLFSVPAVREKWLAGVGTI